MYYDAELHGQQGDCLSYYENCPISFLDMISDMISVGMRTILWFNRTNKIDLSLNECVCFFCTLIWQLKATFMISKPHIYFYKLQIFILTFCEWVLIKQINRFLAVVTPWAVQTTMGEYANINVSDWFIDFLNQTVLSEELDRYCKQ